MSGPNPEPPYDVSKIAVDARSSKEISARDSEADATEVRTPSRFRGMCLPVRYDESMVASASSSRQKGAEDEGV